MVGDIGVNAFLGIWVLKHTVNNKIHLRMGNSVVGEKFCNERHKDLGNRIGELKDSVDKLVSLHMNKGTP